MDNNAGETIWTNADGWYISENRPTSQEVPVVVEEVSFDAYAEGGSDVTGNKNGAIYKLTWYVKDGAMLRSNNYSLIYEVDVDTKEKGFKYDAYYPANGNTTIDYTQNNGDEVIEVTENIIVPDVIVDKPVCENKPESGNKPENGDKPSCGNKPEGNKPESGKKSSCDDKTEVNKSESSNKTNCGDKSEGNKNECGNKNDGENTGCGSNKTNENTNCK